jgi:hypothetical protein
VDICRLASPQTSYTPAGTTQILQEHGAHCAIHAIHNAVPLNPYLEQFKKVCGPEAVLEVVRKAVNGLFCTPCKLGRTVAKTRSDMFQWLLKQDCGTYAVEFDTGSGWRHAVTWRAAAGGSSILETDPAYPEPLPVEHTVLKMLGIQETTIMSVSKKYNGLMRNVPNKCAVRCSPSKCWCPFPSSFPLFLFFP